MKTAAAAFVVASTLLSSTLAGPAIERRGSITPVTVKGNAFFAGNDRFYIRGVDYQPGGSSSNADPIADEAGCQRDIAEFQKLGINTVRVYAVDNSKNHDACMSALASAGIYLALDVNTPGFSLNRLNEQAIAASYNDVYLQSIFATVDAFAKYSNTLLFFSGNEVINSDNTTFAAPYVKAVTRDIKAYMQARNYRSIPVGYSAADVESNRYQMASYMNCGPDIVRSDFFAYNDYSWCDPSSYQQSGWEAKVALFGNYSLPLFLSEYGCNHATRNFEEVAALYNSEMTGVYSGGLVYEYTQESNMFGLVEVDGSDVKELPDFTALQAAYKNTSNPTGDGGYKASGAASNCPAASDSWDVNTTDLPAMPAGALKYFSSGAGAGPGNDGTTSSQNAGTPSTSMVSDNTPSGSGSSNSSSSSGGKKSAATNVNASMSAAGLIAVASGIFVALLI